MLGEMNFVVVIVILVCNKWIELDCDDDSAPDELEEHSMVPYQVILKY